MERAGRRLASESSIITTEANEIMSPIHDRMPVILNSPDWEEWLDRDDMRPAPAHLLRAS